VRKIKFRAWNDISKEMLYHGKDIQGLIWWNEFGEIQSLAKAELMQSTGLKDKNGKEIYEGDIIKSKISFEGKGIPHMGEVVYDKELASFATKNLSGNTLICRQQLNTFEVIGNKYENPELIENEE
jgi:uncharacterized phage protein (TIGR01671 family)